MAAVPNNPDLATALNALTAFLQQQQQQPTAAAPTTTNVVLNPFDTIDPFDLATRAGSSAYATACEPLSTSWDGNAETLPAFVVALQLKAREVGWNKTGDTGILKIANQDLLTDYQKLSLTDIEAASTARTNDRAKQNARAMYHCLKQSITGDLQTILFQQVNNLPREDGPELFFKMTEYSVSSSVVLSMNAVQRLLNYDPASKQFKIAEINSELLHLFTLARTSTHSLGEPEKLQYTLTVYNKIHQPESWAVWVRNQTDKIEEGALANCQQFMNQAVLKQQKIRRVEGSFQGSLNTLQQDVVAMVAAAAKKTVPKRAGKRPTKDNNAADDGQETPSGTDSKAQPPFVKHFKTSNEPEAPHYKVGDSKQWNGITWYFCDCPVHRNKLKWHAHEASACKTRQRWLAEKEEEPKPGSSEPTANIADKDDSDDTNKVDDDDKPEGHPASALLASVMSSLSGNSAAQAFIAEAINTLE